MAADLPELLEVPESESFDRKRALDPTKPDDLLGLVADLTAMANTSGGAVLVGETGKIIPTEHLPLFDSARLDDKVNSLVEPRVCGIRSTVLRDEFVLVEIEKSQNPPHVFKKDGNFHDAQNKPRLVFRLGDILARHSSKTERASRSDFDRWFEESRKHLFENVRIVFEAGPAAHIQVTEQEGPPVRIDPTAPDAQPIYDLLTPDPFRDLEQELVGGVKAWKTSGQFLNEIQILKAYAQRGEISDPEVLELILRSCWEHRLPGYYWATRIHPPRLFTALEEVISADRYPASAEALKVAVLLPSAWGKALLGNTASSRRSVQNLRRKLEGVLRARTRKHATLAHSLYPSKNLKYKGAQGQKEVRVDTIGEQVFEELLSTLPREIKENRGPFRLSELLTYGAALQEVQVEDAAEAEGPLQNGPETESN
jgi:Schlafen, AlbA_2